MTKKKREDYISAKFRISTIKLDGYSTSPVRIKGLGTIVIDSVGWLSVGCPLERHKVNNAEGRYSPFERDVMFTRSSEHIT